MHRRFIESFFTIITTVVMGRREVPERKDAAPIKANTPGSTHSHPTLSKLWMPLCKLL